jgi:WD40 repeat protein
MNGRGPEEALPPGLTLHAPGTPLTQAQEIKQHGSDPVIADHQWLKKIGGGSYGAVWLARNVMGTYRAVKVVYRHTFGDTAHFEREYKGLQKFEPISRSHEGLVDILQIGRDDEAGYFYYVMELADDAALPRESEDGRCKIECRQDAAVPLDPQSSSIIHHPSDYIPRTLRADLKARGRLPLDECIQLGLSLSSALEHLHQHGLVHRDIKPSNIIFVCGVPKLADIGLVTAIDEAHSMVGTVGYIPPEGPGTPQADLYSVGKVLYEVCLGKDRQEFPQLPPDLQSHPEYRGLLELNDIILKACATAPRERYQSAQEMFADLALLKGGKSVRRLRMIERRLKVTTRIGLVTAGLLVVAAVAYLFAVSQTRQTERERANTARLLYAADMNVAQQALEAGNLVRATALLESHRPKPGRDDLRGFEWYYLKKLCRGDEAYMFHGHTQAVQSVAISPEGKLLASASDDQTIQIWDLSARTNVVTLRGHRGAVNAVAFSTDGTLLASGGADKSVKLWEVARWAVVGDLTNHQGAVTTLAFSPDGKLLAAGTEGTGAKLWNISRREIVLQTEGKEGAARLVAISPDGELLATGGTDWSVTLWDLSTTKAVTNLYDQPGFTWGMTFSPDSKILATTKSDCVLLWDVPKRRLLDKLRGHSGEVHPVVFSPDGSKLGSGSEDTTVRMWDFATRQSIRNLKGHSRLVTALAFCFDGTSLLSSSADHTLRLWDLRTNNEPDILRGHIDGVNAVAFSPDDKMLASAGIDRTVKLWDVSSGTNLATLTGHTGPVTAVTFSSDGNTLCSCSLDQTIRFWNVRERQQVALLQCPTELASLALSADGRTLVSGSGWWDDLNSPSNLRFWDIRSRRLMASVSGATGMVHVLAFAPDATTLAVGLLGDTSLELLDVTSKQVVFSSTNLGERFAFSPEGRTMAVQDSTDWDRIALLDLGTGRTTAKFETQGNTMRWMAMSPDGRTLAVSYADASIKLCNVATGRVVVTLRGHEGFCPHLAFSHDGQTLASAGNDKTVRLWRAPRIEAALVVTEASASR